MVSRRFKYQELRKIALDISLMLLLCSCEHKDLCFDHESHAWQSAVEVSAQYELEWEYPLVPRGEWSYDIPYNSLRPEIPEGLRAMVYSTGYPAAVTNLPAAGGVVRVPVGLSDILFQNNDTEGIVFDNLDNIASAQASTRLKTRLGYSGVQVRDATVGEPDVLFAASLTGHRGESLEELVHVNVTMTPLVYTYYIRCEFSEGAEHIVLMRGALEGMARGVYLTTGHTTSETCNVLFDGERTPFGAHAMIRSFGVPDHRNGHFNRGGRDGREYRINLEFRLRNGKTKTFNLDITPQISEAPQGGVITVCGLVITPEEASGNASGFDVEVEDWGEFEDIPLVF